MEDINLSFLLYFVDQRDVQVVRDLVERAFQCELKIVDVDVPEDEKADSFEGESLGLSLSFQRGHAWPDGMVYRLSGASRRRSNSSSASRIVIDGHIARTLEAIGLSQIMSRDEFASLDRKLSR